MIFFTIFALASHTAEVSEQEKREGMRFLILGNAFTWRSFLTNGIL